MGYQSAILTGRTQHGQSENVGSENHNDRPTSTTPGSRHFTFITMTPFASRSRVLSCAMTRSSSPIP